MASVAQVAARYANFLVHPHPPGPGICQVCHGPSNRGYPTCLRCGQAGRIPGSGVADAVVPISLSLKTEQYANELWRYKNAHGPQKEHFRIGLAAVLWQFLVRHEACITRHCAVPRFDLVTIVPSTSGRADHPLRTMVAETVGVTRNRYRDLLASTPSAAGLAREASIARYTSAALWSSETVLLIDDTWTTGGHAQSAAAALKAAGASCVAIVVLGRHLNGSGKDTASHVEQARPAASDGTSVPCRTGPMDDVAP